MTRSLWRIGDFASLDGGGGLEFSARWHTAGRRIVYLAKSVPGALVEVLVHLEIDEEDWPNSYTLLHVELPGGAAIADLIPQGADWQGRIRETRQIGDAWLAERGSALARVPSAILPFTWNYLLNPIHPDAANAKVVEATQHLYDPRLLQIRGA